MVGDDRASAILSTFKRLGKESGHGAAIMALRRRFQFRNEVGVGAKRGLGDAARQYLATRVENDRHALETTRRKEEWLRIKIEVVSVEQHARERRVIARRHDQRTSRSRIKMRRQIAGECAKHFALAARGERQHRLPIEIASAGYRRGELRRLALGGRDYIAARQARRELKGESRRGAALLKKTVENRGGRFGMKAKRQRRAGRRFGVDNVDKAECKFFELPNVSGRMYRSLDKLIDDGAKHQRVDDPTLFLIGAHCKNRLNPYATCGRFSIRSLTEH